MKDFLNIRVAWRVLKQVYIYTNKLLEVSSLWHTWTPTAEVPLRKNIGEGGVGREGGREEGEKWRSGIKGWGGGVEKEREVLSQCFLLVTMLSTSAFDQAQHPTPVLVGCTCF